MKFEVRRVKNGFVLLTEDDEEVVYAETCEDEVEVFAMFLRYLNDEFGPATSRYSSKRIRIAVEPGDKYEGLSDE